MLLACSILAFAAGCSDPTVDADIGDRSTNVALPSDVTVIVPAGWHGDARSLVDDTVSSLRLLAVDETGTVTTVTTVDVSGGGASNQAVADANRALGVKRLIDHPVPAGSGFGDVLAGTRAAFELTQHPARVVSLATGCLDTGGQRLSTADLSTDAAVATAAQLIAAAGVLRFPAATDGDVLILAGLASCAANGVDTAARLQLAKRLCADTGVACVVRQAEVTR